MSESKTPRTDSAIRNGCPEIECAALETELSELNRKITDGELIPINTVVTWLRQNQHYGRARDIECSGLKEFAKRKAKE